MLPQETPVPGEPVKWVGELVKGNWQPIDKPREKGIIIGGVYGWQMTVKVSPIQF